MPKPADVMITVPVYQQQQDEVSKFLKIKPAALGIMEILLALLGFGLAIWNRFSLLWSPISFFLTGALTFWAAHTCKPCLVKSSQLLSYLSATVAVFSLCFHFFSTWGVSCFLLMACDSLILVFSVAVALTLCSCCCRPKSRNTAVSYRNPDLPVNHIVLTRQPDPSALAQSVSSVLYVLPATHGPVPPVPLPNCGTIPNASPPNYSPVPDTPPPTYDQVLPALLANYSPNPSTPPPPYEYEDFQTR